MEKVSVVECRSYQEEEVYLAVRESIKRIGFVIPENITVLIKPNIMSQNRPEQHTITHFSLIAALCRILKEKNCRIMIGESISFFEKGLTVKAFRTSGIEEVANKYGASLVAFEEVPLVKKQEGLRGLKEIYFPEVLFQADMVINACKLKTHEAMRLSGAVKNMFGCLPGGYKQKIHRWTGSEFELSDVFIDIQNIVKPALSIMDAVESLDGGPTALGRPVNTSRILASTNPAALDYTASRMIGYEVKDLPILLQAQKRGMIEDYEDIEVLGEVPSFKFRKLITGDIYHKTNKDSIFVKDTYVDLKIDQKKCSRCKKCIGVCPVSAISEAEKRIDVDTEKCISCYYCLSICPESAIKIKPSKMNRLIRGIRTVTGI